MRTSKHIIIGLITVAFLVSAVALVQPPASQALDLKGGFQFKKILKKIFPPCGPGSRHERFVVKGEKVCDNKTGLWWQKSPSTDVFAWQEAIDHCSNLELTGNHHKKKQWRLAEVKELISLVDYSVLDQATNLNAPNGPFMNVQPDIYWSATEFADDPTNVGWFVLFANGNLGFFRKDGTVHAWCVSGGQDAH
jgi:hypothetical protein